MTHRRTLLVSSHLLLLAATAPVALARQDSRPSTTSFGRPAQGRRGGGQVAPRKALT